MAGRPSKAVSELTGNYAKEEIRLKMQISEKNARIVELEKQLQDSIRDIKSLKAENTNLKTQLTYDKTDDDKVRKILNYCAKGYHSPVILEKMSFNGYDLDIEYISNIRDNIEDLENELVLYYNEQKKAYEESIKINSEALKDNMLYIQNSLIEDAFKQLKDTTDDDKRIKIREEIIKITKEMNNVTKNIDENNANGAMADIYSSMDRIDKINKSIKFIIQEEEEIIN